MKVFSSLSEHTCGLDSKENYRLNLPEHLQTLHWVCPCAKSSGGMINLPLPARWIATTSSISISIGWSLHSQDTQPKKVCRHIRDVLLLLLTIKRCSFNLHIICNEQRNVETDASCLTDHCGNENGNTNPSVTHMKLNIHMVQTEQAERSTTFNTLKKFSEIKPADRVLLETSIVSKSASLDQKIFSPMHNFITLQPNKDGKQAHVLNLYKLNNQQCLYQRYFKFYYIFICVTFIFSCVIQNKQEDVDRKIFDPDGQKSEGLDRAVPNSLKLHSWCWHSDS